MESYQKNWRWWLRRNLRRNRLGHKRTSCSKTGVCQTAETSFENGSSSAQKTAR